MNPSFYQQNAPPAPTGTGLQAPTMPQVYGTNANDQSTLSGDINQAQGLLGQLNTPTKPPANSGAKTNLFERLLPTIGSVLGGIGGGIAGTVAAPFTGGIINPIDAGIAGAGLGGGLGKTGENALTGQGLGGGVLASAGEGALGQAGGEVLGLGLKGAGGFLSNLGSGEGETALSTADKAAMTKNNFGGIRPEVQSSNNLKNNQALLDKFGVDSTSPEAMSNASKGGLFLDDIHNEALGLGQPVNTSDLVSGGDIFKSSPEEQQAMAESGIIDQNGQIPSTVTPQQAQSFARSLNTQLREAQSNLVAAQRAGSASDISAFRQQVNNLSTMYNKVQDVAATPEVNQAIADRTVTPVEKAQLVGRFGQKEADYLEQQVNNAQTSQDLTKAKLPFAQMNNLSDLAMKDAQASATPREVARVKQGGLGQSITKGGLNFGGLLEAAKTGNPLFMVPGLAMDIGSKPIGSALTALGSTGNGIIPKALGGVVANSPNDIPTSNAGSTIGTTGANPMDNSVLSQLLSAELAQSKEALVDPSQFNTSASIGGLASLIPMMQHIQAAETGGQNLASTFNAAGGAQGPIGGFLSRLGQTFTGGPAGFGNNQLGAQQQQEAQLLQSLTGATPRLPSIYSNQPTANQALENMSNLISALGGGQSQPSSVLGSLSGIQ